MELTEIKKWLEEFLKMMGFDNFEIRIQENIEEKTMKFLIETDRAEKTSGVLIGRQGENLRALEIILNSAVRKKLNDASWRILVDVNNYLTLREEKLREIARKLAHQVVLAKKQVELPPMSPRDRRIIHLELSLSTAVTTESIGEGEKRRIIIKPIE